MSGLALEGGPTCEVFDFDINSWRHVESPPYKIIDDKYDPTYVDGSLYWFICEENTKRKRLGFSVIPEAIFSSNIPTVPMASL
ncbi:hypothetical protein YC2023_099290 [Brassica napus]